jgi:hypothetical protein
MTNKLKAATLTIATICLGGAIAASGASASTFMAESYPVQLVGSQIVAEPHEFEVNAQTITCSTVSFATSASISTASTTVTVHPNYSSCTTFGFIGSTVTTTGCDYVLHSAETVEADKYDGMVDVVCSGTNKIIIKGGGCRLQIGSQSGLGTVRFENNTAASPKDVKVVASVNGIVGEVTESHFPCAHELGGFEGSYAGGTTVKAVGGVDGITVED